MMMNNKCSASSGLRSVTFIKVIISCVRDCKLDIVYFDTISNAIYSSIIRFDFPLLIRPI